MIKYYSIIDDRGTISPLRKKCISSLTDNLGGNSHAVIEVPYSDDIFEMIARVDRVKYRFGATDPDACIVDTDCFISKPLHEFELVTGRPYFAKYDFNGLMTTPDTYYFYVNGCTDWFKNNLPTMLAKGDKYSLSPNILTKLSGFEYIPEMSYCHFYDSMRRVADLAALDRAVKKLNDISKGVAYLNQVVNNG